MLTDALSLFIRPDEPVELRFLGVERPGRVHAGWMTLADAPAVASKVAAMADRSEGVYFTPQRLRPEVLSRSPRGHFGNVVRVKGGETKPRLTHDDDVSERRYLLIDIDPKRPPNVCATNAEKAAAEDLCVRVQAQLCVTFRQPLIVDSGNGFHLYYRLPTPLTVAGPKVANDSLAVLLRLLAERYDTPQAAIDCRVHNPARIMKLAGSWSRKGPNTPERPHRQSRILEVPSDWHPA
jgi:hypothetical protein